MEILVHTYTQLGLTDNAHNAQRVLDENFAVAKVPGETAESEPDSGFDKLTFGLFKNDDTEAQ